MTKEARLSILSKCAGYSCKAGAGRLLSLHSEAAPVLQESFLPADTVVPAVGGNNRGKSGRCYMQFAFPVHEDVTARPIPSGTRKLEWKQSA